MSSEEDIEIRLTHLEDLVNRMNFVLAEQGRKQEDLSSKLSIMDSRLKALEEGTQTQGGSASYTAAVDPYAAGPSEMPPDGGNR